MSFDGFIDSETVRVERVTEVVSLSGPNTYKLGLFHGKEVKYAEIECFIFLFKKLNTSHLKTYLLLIVVDKYVFNK